MIQLSELQDYLNDLLYFDKSLDLSKIDPLMANGLQVKGREEIKKIGFGVSASMALFRFAVKEKCDVLIVHHSINLPPYNRYDQIFQERVGFLIRYGISLFGYHFLLDGHPEIGHNVLVLKKIGAEPIEPYYFKDAPWGWIGEIKKLKAKSKIRENLMKIFSSKSVWYEFGPDKIKKVVAISGKGAPYSSGMQELIDKKIDLFITGEVHEWNREMFREAKINFVAGGHYCTEVLGLRELEKRVKKDLPANTVFIDLPNEV